MTRHGPGRPRLHLTTEHGWVNDPLGLTYHHGVYHLFFQHLPGRTTWSPACCWGHATSEDLVTWTSQPLALAPGEGDDGCWSGSLAVPERGEASLFYTSVHLDDLDLGQVRIAHPADRSWRSWRKGEVVVDVPTGVDARIHRDPYVFAADGRWRMLVGAGLTDGTATALVYVSEDLATWTFEGELARRHTSLVDPVWTGDGWECPQLFPLGDRWVLVVSVWDAAATHDVVYAVGDYTEGRFTAHVWDRLVHGPCGYATSAFVDAEGRRGLVSWLRGVHDVDAGWAGAISLPQVVRLDGSRLVVEPHPGVTARRRTGRIVHPGATTDVRGPIDLDWVPAGSGELILDAGAAGTLLLVAVTAGTLSARTEAGVWSMPVVDGRVRIIIDGPVVEVFAGAGVMALCVSVSDARSVSVAGAGGLTAYPLSTDD